MNRTYPHGIPEETPEERPEERPEETDAEKDKGAEEVGHESLSDPEVFRKAQEDYLQLMNENFETVEIGIDKIKVVQLTDKAWESVKPALQKTGF